MNEQDREIAPMVDGLSSGLCMLILIATVFMIGAINVNIANTAGGIQFQKSVLDLNSSTVFFADGLNLSRSEYQEISRQINNQPGKTLSIYGYIAGENNDSEQKLIYNFVTMKQGIKTDKDFNFIKGNSSLCHNNRSCIHWEIR